MSIYQLYRCGKKQYIFSVHTSISYISKQGGILKNILITNLTNYIKNFHTFNDLSHLILTKICKILKMQKFIYERMTSMKNYSTTKKIISYIMTIIMILSIFNITNPKQVQAATYPLKVHYLDVKGDATLIKYTYNGKTYYGMIDAGQETENNKASESAAAYFAGIADKAGNPRTLDFCIITHAHDDHYIGLKYFDDYNIHVNKMYVNDYYRDIQPDGKVSLNTRLNSMKNNGAINQIIYIGHNDSSNVITYNGGFSLTILGPVLSESNNTSDPGAAVVNVRSMMCTLDYDNYKYIFMGDIYEKDGKGLPTITNNDLYEDYLVPSRPSIKVVYKISHHGRRNAGNYNASAEAAMYDYISNKGTNKVYCIANKYFSSSSEYATSTNLQNLWYNKTGNVYFNTGYKKTSQTAYSAVSRDTVNGISALTSTTSLGFN